MIATLATLSWLLTAQATEARPDTVTAKSDSDSTHIATPVTDASGVPRLAAARVSLGPATFAASEGMEISDSATTQRRHAVEHSEWYYRRLTIHKVASYATLPLFATEWVLGDKLYNGTASSSTKATHGAVATGIGVLFGVNTVTGVWNLWDSRHEAEGRARRTTHALLMLAADAGMVATAALAPGENEFENNGEPNNQRSQHRAVAIGSMSLATVSYLMMFFWK